MNKTARSSRVLAAVLGGVTLALAAGLLSVDAAWAHIDPTPATVTAGSTVTVQFQVEHGCSGSPTTKLDIKPPAGVTDVKPVDKPGWTATSTAGVVTFAGGPLGPDTADHFDLSVRVPATPGNLVFPVVQTCVKGSISWIEPGGGASESDRPAPVVRVTAGAPTSSEVAGSHDQTAASASGEQATGPGAGSSSESSSGPAAGGGQSTGAGTGLDTIAGVKKPSDSKGPLIVSGAVAVVVVLAGGLALTRFRNRQT